MSKKLDITAITNELEGSAFFPRKTPPVQQPQDLVPTPRSGEIQLHPQPHDTSHLPQQPNTHTRLTKQPVPPVPLVRDVRPGLPVPPKKRVMKPRHPFDIYQDQYDSLKQLADKERRQGGVGSMSAMVREALDKLIAEKRNK